MFFNAQIKLIKYFQVSGNLLILSDNVVNIHAFKIRTHDISKMKFIDFEEIPIFIELAFSPIYISICENYIGYHNRDSMHLFKIMECIKDQNCVVENDMSFPCEY